MSQNVYNQMSETLRFSGSIDQYPYSSSYASQLKSKTNPETYIFLVHFRGFMSRDIYNQNTYLK